MDAPKKQPQIFLESSDPDLKDYEKQLNTSSYLRIVKQKPCFLNPGVFKVFSRLTPVNLPLLGDGRQVMKKISIHLDNNVYLGEVNNKFERDGFGVLVMHDGSLYEGYFSMGSYCGKGRLITLSGDVYYGDWTDQMLQGQGIIYIQTPYSYYTGDLVDSIPHGEGIMQLPDGSTYEGSFVKGRREGNGHLKNADGSYYVGEFRKNKQAGKGTFYFKDQSYITGTWENCQIIGVATKKWIDGTIYEGEFLEGRADGKGKMQWPDGRVYDGYWKSDRPNGRGCEYKPNGAMIEGNWSAGKVYHIIRELPANNRGSYADAICDSVRELEEKVKEARRKRHKTGNGKIEFQALLDKHEIKEYFDKEYLKSEKKERQKAKTDAQLLKNQETRAIEKPQIKPLMKLEDSEKFVESLCSYDLSSLPEKYTKIIEKRQKYTNFDFFEAHIELPEVASFQEIWLEVGEDSIYRGELDSKKLPSGRGIMISTKQIYEGFFVAGRKQGLGREINMRGDFTGYFFKDHKWGFGVKRSGHNLYIGEYEDDLQSGAGSLKTSNAYYEGQWKKGKQHGKGRLKFEDGRIYEGDFEEGIIKGYGTIIWPSGKSIAGFWENGEIIKSTNTSNSSTKSIGSMNESKISQVDSPRNLEEILQDLNQKAESSI